MSRIGNSPITITEGVTVTQEGRVITVKGKLGELTQEIDSSITVLITNNIITLTRESDDKESRSKHGLYRALIANMTKGVTNGYLKKLEFRSFSIQVRKSFLNFKIWQLITEKENF